MEVVMKYLILVMVIGYFIYECFLRNLIEIIEESELEKNQLFEVGDTFMCPDKFQYQIVSCGDSESPEDAWYIIEIYDLAGNFLRLSQISHDTLSDWDRVVDITILDPVDVEELR